LFVPPRISPWRALLSVAFWIFKLATLSVKNDCAPTAALPNYSYERNNQKLNKNVFT